MAQARSLPIHLDPQQRHNLDEIFGRDTLGLRDHDPLQEIAGLARLVGKATRHGPRAERQSAEHITTRIALTPTQT
jgi:hypothetical protein